MLPPLIGVKKPAVPPILPKEEHGQKENRDFKFEDNEKQPGIQPAVRDHDRDRSPRDHPQHPSALQSHAAKSFGKTGGFLNINIKEQDKIPAEQDLENKEEVLKRIAAYFRVIPSGDAPNYVENIVTAQFDPVTKPPADRKEVVLEYETAEEIYDAEMKSYLESLTGFQIRFLLFLAGILAGKY